MAITLASTVVEYVRLHLDSLESGNWITDDQIEAELFPFVHAETNLQFNRMRNGRWQYNLAVNRPGYLYLMSSSDVSFSGVGGADYTIHPRGMLKQTAGTTDTSSSISVLTCPIELPRGMVSICVMAASQWSRKIAMAIAGGQMDPTSVENRLLQMAGVWQGMVAG